MVKRPSNPNDDPNNNSDSEPETPNQSISQLNPNYPLPNDSDSDGGEEIREEVEEFNNFATGIEDEDDEGENLFGENFEDDYKAIPQLDNYDSSQLDDSRQYAPMDQAAKRKVDALLNQRDRMQFGQLNDSFLFSEEGGFFDGQAGARRLHRHLTGHRYHLDSDLPALSSDIFSGVQEAAVSAEMIGEAEAAGYSLNEFVMIENFRNRIVLDFERFLKSFSIPNSSTPYYLERIREMCIQNKESFEVSFLHLMDANSFLAKLLVNVPSEVVKIFDEAALRVVLFCFEQYDQICPEIHVRFSQIPTIDTLRELRFIHLNTLVRVTGVVTRRSGVFPQLQLVKYDCVKCGDLIGPFYQDIHHEIKIGACPSCQSKGPFQVNISQTIYRNYQRMTLQETPGTIPAGRLPRHKEVILLGDLIDNARPGDEVEIIGIYKNNFASSLNNVNSFPVFSTVIEANNLIKKDDSYASHSLTEDDVKEIRALATDPLIARRVFQSIAPSIYGHSDIKTAIALAIFGGQSKNVAGKHQLRGDINILLLGDPGTAKSQFLKYAEKISPRAVFTTGQGASAVGLTAAVRKDPVTREWTLEGGALVLADKGICLIDEFDKMNDRDRTSIHEAMEQQSISISKAGIVTSLQARCSVIAAANPIRGRYNSSVPFSQNVALSDPILSRFDILCVVKDVPDPVADDALAKFVVGSHIRSHPSATEEDMHLVDSVQCRTQDVTPLDQELLRKYIVYAKTKVFPQISHLDSDKISRLYSDLRKESLHSGGSVPITVRHIESIVRIAEASARIHLRDWVKGDDLDLAIRVVLESFVGAQKFSVMKSLRKSFSKYTLYNRDSYELLLFVLGEMVRESIQYLKFKNNQQSLDTDYTREVRIGREDFEGRARQVNVPEVNAFLKSRLFVNSSYGYDESSRNFYLK